jgi:hypothetical protein
MKKREKEFKHWFGPLKLYLADVEEIVGILGTNGRTVEISNSKYTFDDVKDLANANQESLNELVIESSIKGELGYPKETIRLWLAPTSATLSTSSRELTTLGVCSRVVAVVQNREKRFRQFFHPKWVEQILVNVLLAVAVYSLKLGWYGSVLQLGFILWIVISFYNSIWRHSIVILKHEHQHSTFWTRNRETMFTAVVTSVLTLPTGLISGYMIAKITEKPAESAASHPATSQPATSQPSATSQATIRP